VPVRVTHVTRVYTNTSKGMAMNSKLKRLNRNNIVELILYPDSDDVVSVGLGNGQKSYFSLIRRDHSKQLPSLDCIWD
jgi:hypothetical protein